MRFFAACIVLGYEALHGAHWVYRDMKPANVLLSSRGYCCLIDFGLAARVEHRAVSGKCGTRGYWAPEMVKGDPYTFSSDWYPFSHMSHPIPPISHRLNSFSLSL